MINGSVVALVTPMDEAGAIDYSRLEALVEFHVSNGTDAILVAGTTGEPSTLSVKEHTELIHQTVKLVGSRVPVIAGSGSNSTAEAVELTRYAKKAGADACLLVTPYYNRPTQEGLFLHHKTVAESVAIPQIVYNVPRRTGVDLLPSTAERLSRIPNIIGIKDATGEAERGRQLMEACGDRLSVFSGDDAVGLDFMRRGARGVISVTANVAPRQMHEMCAYALKGMEEEAHKINMALETLHRDLFCESNPIPVKWALWRMGLIGLGIRLPLTVLAPMFHALVEDALITANLLGEK